MKSLLTLWTIVVVICSGCAQRPKQVQIPDNPKPWSSIYTAHYPETSWDGEWPTTLHELKLKLKKMGQFGLILRVDDACYFYVVYDDPTLGEQVFCDRWFQSVCVEKIGNDKRVKVYLFQSPSDNKNRAISIIYRSVPNPNIVKVFDIPSKAGGVSTICLEKGMVAKTL